MKKNDKWVLRDPFGNVIKKESDLRPFYDGNEEAFATVLVIVIVLLLFGFYMDINSYNPYKDYINVRQTKKENNFR